VARNDRQWANMLLRFPKSIKVTLFLIKIIAFILNLVRTEEIIRKQKKIIASKRKTIKNGQREQNCSSIAIPIQAYHTRSACLST